MRLSAPVYHLKRQARLLSRKENVPLHEALDRMAFKEGFGSWSLLAAKAAEAAPAGRLLAQLIPGDMVLVAARPGQGKTLMSLELAVAAMKQGSRAVFFTLEYMHADILDRFRDIGVDPAVFDHLFEFDNSDAISAAYIIEALGSAPRGTLAVIDYLQLLDQKREDPELMVQIRALRSFARERGLVLVFISQVDRSYDASRKPFPDLDDVRLPNPLDLSLFDKMCFLNKGEIRFQSA
ncbi:MULTISPECIES: DNA helicase [unclassified Mesorhizobium]|uniref:DNA helicase n=1 Tax=unclassified Mesorhizobium TaxID=325217 RepID=UPI00080143AB|nr:MULTISPECIES: DNA helicase [unclassified Mesorhizobium]OBQ84451.1 DNA helicase [Mesorhizobium sp. WSM3873]PBB32520.1 DNA helicase [Mesorhizobium sp. WSM3868]PBB90156.1 DNA helicase [Mesorhizobium sp. WSM3864]PBB99457.1 DNA helicase [Mesorhizobium sp. WSM3862]